LCALLDLKGYLPLRLFPRELTWLFPRIKAQLPRHLASFLCLTAASLLALVTPLSLRWLIDRVLPSQDTGLIALGVGFIFVSYQGRASLNALGAYLTFLATQQTSVELRMSLLRHLDSLSADYFDRTPVGELAYLFGGPIDEVSYFGSELLPSLLRAAIAAAVTLSAMSTLSLYLTLAVAPVVPAFLVLRHWSKRRIEKQADQVQGAQTRYNSFLEEHLRALTQFQLLRRVKVQEGRALELLRGARISQVALWKTGILFSLLSHFAIVSGISLTLAGGSWLVLRRSLSIGTLVAFYGLLVQLFDPLTSATEMYRRAQRTFASIRQIRSAFENLSHVPEYPHAKPLPAGHPWDLEFNDATFRYRQHGDPIQIPHLQIAQGEKVAIAGPNGAGKSTFLKLIARLYDVTSGEIRISGMDIRRVGLESLRSAVCYLPAQPVLFQGSIADNLQAGMDGSRLADLRAALFAVGLRKYDGGPLSCFDQKIAPGASNLSNGERQRLALARALLLRPKILILDETTCSLDPDSEWKVLHMLDQRLPRTTILVVCHRLDSLAWRGRVLRIDRGRIVEDRNGYSLSTSKLGSPR
jgi:ABC-type multidrug transport system fused ATPase/permease subunit